MKNRGKAFLWIITFSLIVLCIAPFLGMQHISPVELFQNNNQIKTHIFWQIRIPRVIIAFLAGASLSVCGMIFQAMFRNPLATPFTLGVSSGAAFGAAMTIKIGTIFSIFGIVGQSVGAFLGALTSILLVYGLSRLRQGFSTANMLITGVAMNFFFSSIILFIQYLSDFTGSFRIIRWLMGGFETVGFRPVLTLMPFLLIGGFVITFFIKELNIFLLGDDIAISRGVNVIHVKRTLFFATSLLIGAVVSVCGPIGFIGMMAPHMCRLIIGADHRFLAPASFLFGGAFLVFCDTLARTIIAPTEIPVGVLTALLGGPFFIWLLLNGSLEKRIMQ